MGAASQTALLQGSTTTITSSGAGNDVTINSADTIELLDPTNVSGDLTASTFNALSLQANAVGFQVSGGTTTKTLVIADNVTLNQNLRITDSPTFSALTLTNALTPSNGGTGIAGGPTADGQLLIGSAGGTYTRTTLTAGNGRYYYKRCWNHSGCRSNSWYLYRWLC